MRLYLEAPDCLRCRMEGRAATAARWIAETLTQNVALCDDCYERMIRHAEQTHPEYEPGVVRSCMERASYPLPEVGK